MDEHYDDPEYTAIMREAVEVTNDLIKVINDRNKLEEEINKLTNRAWGLQIRMDRWKEETNE